MDRSVKRWKYTWPAVGEASIKTRVRESAAPPTGIYLLTFADGQHYVGKATDVAGRFAHHAARWSDIESVRFSPIAAADLDEYERGTVRLYEGPGRLRNKLLTGYLNGSSPLDDVMPSNVQEAWWRDLAEAPEVPVVVGTGSGTAGANHFRVRSRNDYAHLVALTATFVREVIPWPATTHGEYWTVSTRTGTDLVSVDCRGRELFALWSVETRRGREVRGSFAAARLTRDASWMKLLSYSVNAGLPSPWQARSGMLLEDVFFNGRDQLARRLAHRDVSSQARLAAVGQMRAVRKAPKDADPKLAADVLDAVYMSGS